MRCDLLGKPFILQTDHKALKWLQQFKGKKTRLTRWSLSLQPFNFTVGHQKGSDNANADALSRLLHFVQKKEEGEYDRSVTETLNGKHKNRDSIHRKRENI